MNQKEYLTRVAEAKCIHIPKGVCKDCGAELATSKDAIALIREQLRWIGGNVYSNQPEAIKESAAYALGLLDSDKHRECWGCK